MQPVETITPAELPDALLRIAPVRPVHLWGQPGIGKSVCVEAFAADLGMPCVTLLGTQLAAEDLIGVPQLVTDAAGVTRSRFAPPEMIARTDPYVLFLDELNGSSTEVQKAFYSLVLERRLGNYELPPGSVIIAAGNRATDQAIVKPMSSALANRFVHLHLRASTRDWLEWAAQAGVHPWVLDYIRARPDHLVSTPPKTEEPFSTPRSWHALSDVLKEWGQDINDTQVAMLAYGTLTPAHAASFRGYVKTRQHAYDLDAILKGTLRWPAAPEDRDTLHFLALSLRARLIKELPADKASGSANARALAVRAKALLVELADISVELAELVVAGDDNGRQVYPSWFLIEVVRDLPRLVTKAG